MATLRSFSRLLVLAVLLLVAREGAAVELAVFTPAAPGAAPATATVRQLDGVEIWIFDDARERDAALTRAGTGTALGAGETLRLERFHAGHRVRARDPEQVLWSNERFRIVGSDTGASCSERLVTVPKVLPRSLVDLVIGSDPAEEAAYVDAADSARYVGILAELSGVRSFDLDGQLRRIVTRYAPDTDEPDGIDLARDYLADRFEAAGYTVIQQDFTAFAGGIPFTASNVVAVHPGTTRADEILVVGAHYDATSLQSGPGQPALGAEDNASGTSAVLLLAEALANFETDRTVHFVAFGAEEQGLYGSAHYVQQAVADGLNVVGALTMDMISVWSTDFGLWIEGEPAWEELMFVVRDNTTQWTPLEYSLHYNSFGSDHVPFQTAGIPAILAIDEDWDEYFDYHRTTDTFDKIDLELGPQVTRAIAGAVADIAGVRRTVKVSAPPPGNGPARSALALLPNRPNPFNPRTTLRFVLPAAGSARLEILDLRGRRVRTVFDGWLDAGPHERTWDGLDAQGRAVSSGLYFSRLVHPDGVRSRSLTLVR